MIKIAHRGNYKGDDLLKENEPSYIDEAISAGYDVLVDAWLLEGKWMLGNNFPTYEVPLSFFERSCIWTRAKNLVGYVSLYHNKKAQVLWHNKDDFAITSKGIKWCNTHILTHDGIMYLPELNDYHASMIRLGHLDPIGICSNDFRKFVS